MLKPRGPCPGIASLRGGCDPPRKGASKPPAAPYEPPPTGDASLPVSLSPPVSQLSPTLGEGVAAELLCPPPGTLSSRHDVKVPLLDGILLGYKEELKTLFTTRVPVDGPSPG